MAFGNISFLCLLIGLLSILGCDGSDNGSSHHESFQINEIQIGALIPLSGDYEDQGDQTLAALNCAMEDINEIFKNDNKNTRIKLVYADTATDPEKANTEIKSFISRGIRIIIGPLTSVEVMGVKDEIDLSNSLLISPSSTLTTLSIAGDNIYRVVPDDQKTVEATVDVMWEQGIRNVAMLYADNAWGQSFVSLLRETFEAKGGTYIGEVSYMGARASELRDYLGELSALIKNSTTMNADASNVAVQLISLDVGCFILELAAEDTILSQVKWFGCDGLVNTDELFYFPEGAKFASGVQFTSPIFGTPPTVESQKLMNRIKLMTGSTPNEYSLLTYDALMVAAKTLEKAGEDAILLKLRETLRSTFSNYSGITGDIVLNYAGDRSSGSYFFWRVMEEDDTFKWEHVITYTDGNITDVDGKANNP